MDGWLIQVTKGDPRDGEQQVELYVAWTESDDDAVMLVIKTFNLPSEDIVSTITILGEDDLAAHGIKEGEAAPYQEALVAS